MVLFYSIAGALALATVIALVRPMFFGRGAFKPRDAREAEIYRDQLGEIERDLARGNIDASEADGARAELSRRLITAAGRSEETAPTAPAPRGITMVMAGFALIGAPALAVGIYLANGMPGQPDLPFDGRSEIEAAQMVRPSQIEAEASFDAGPLPPMTAEMQEYAAMMVRLEKVLEERPEDAKGLELLATGYMRLQRYEDAWPAYERLIAVEGNASGAGLYASMAEAMVMAAGGYVSPKAEQAIGAALARDATLPMARYYGGLLMAQNGRMDDAIAAWERLKAETPGEAPWLEFLNGMLAEAKAVRDGVRGPSAADIEAAGELSPEERQELIAGMVAQLEGRLTSDGGTPEEWLRLMNAYVQLDRRDDAERIARLGIAAFGNRSEAGFLREQALVMGLISE